MYEAIKEAGKVVGGYSMDESSYQKLYFEAIGLVADSSNSIQTFGWPSMESS